MASCDSAPNRTIVPDLVVDPDGTESAVIPPPATRYRYDAIASILDAAVRHAL